MGKIKYWKKYREKNKEKIMKQKKERYSTPKGRAMCQINNYKRKDKKYNRGEIDIDYQWIIDNIYSKHCIYCGEYDWSKLGCDRIDNSKPHTKDNVIPCCKQCNDERKSKEFIDFYLKKLGESPLP